LEIQAGDSVIVIKADGTIGKVIMPEVRNELDKTPKDISKLSKYWNCSIPKLVWN
jgi:hypothetical protein